MLGYREAVFPICFEDTLLGAFFVGQIALDYKLGFIEDRMLSLLQSHPHCFDTYIQLSGLPQSPEQVRDEVIAAHRKWGAIPEHVLTETQHETLLQDTCNALADLETLLSEEMHQQRERYVAKKVRARLEQFRAGLRGAVADTQESLDELWKNVERTMKGIVEDFAFRYAVAFGVTNILRPR